MNHSLLLEETWPAAPYRAPQRLVLCWGAHEREVTDRHPLLTVGRGDFSGIVIKNDKVSRLHASIKYGSMGFTLTDCSCNGTYVSDSKGTVSKVHNVTHLLGDAGTISFGVDPETGRPQLVRYAVRN